MPVIPEQLLQTARQALAEFEVVVQLAVGEVTLVVAADAALPVLQRLRDADGLRFDTLIDVCGVDYSQFGQTEWDTGSATGEGFSRGRIDATAVEAGLFPSRFAAVYHLLSVALNQRIRVRIHAPDDDFPILPSVVALWSGANWYEREAFDLYGIVFEGHPDLRRLLTDYGVVGYPFRKDFPLSGHVDMRYDPEKQRVVYEPTEVKARVLVPRVIRDDSRYQPGSDHA